MADRTPAELRRLKRIRTERDLFDSRLRAAIVVAFKNRDGFTVDDIAQAAGLTRQRIYQIVNEQPR